MVDKFEDLIAWQKARVLTREIYKATRQGQFSKDWGLSNQIQRASVSIMSNIAEGFGRWGPGEFEHFLSIAIASSAEVRSQLYVALDVGYVNETEWQYLYGLALEVGRIIGGLRTSVENQK